MLAVKSYEFPSERGMDAYLKEHAQQTAKPLYGLDTDATDFEIGLISIR